MGKFSVVGVVKFVGALMLNAVVFFGLCVGGDFVLPTVEGLLGLTLWFGCGMV